MNNAQVIYALQAAVRTLQAQVASMIATSIAMLSAATDTVDGYLTHTDHATFNNKISSVAATTPLTGLGTGANPLGLLTVPVTYGGTGLAACASGDLLYGSAANTLSRLAKGTDAQVLTLAGGFPTWAAGGGSSPIVTNISANYSALSSDNVINVTAMAADVTVTLPSAATATNGKTYTIKDSSGKAGGTQLLLVATAGADTIEGNPTRIYLTDDFGMVTLISDGTSNWIVIDTPASAWNPDPRVNAITPSVWLEANRKVTAAMNAGTQRNACTAWTDLVSSIVFNQDSANTHAYGKVGFGGRSIIDTDATGAASGGFASASTITNNSGAFTVFAVVSAHLNGWGSGAGSLGIFGHNLAAGTGGGGRVSGTACSLYGAGTTTAKAAWAPPMSDKPHAKRIGVLCLRYASAGSGVWFDDISVTYGAITNGTFANTTATLFVGEEGSAVNAFAGGLCEFIYFPGNVSDTDRSFLSRALAKKWGN